MRIRLVNLVRRFADQTAVDHLNVELNSGELVCLLGPSGCGKSTTLNMIAGILPVSEGKIYFDDRDVTDLSADQRRIGMVFQNYALYPHMTVLENICFPLEIQKVPKKERIRQAEEIARLVHVEEYLNRRPAQLSGGQQQRVAIARALIKKPDVLLLDEPLSNLDARLRIEMREEIRRIQKETEVTTIFVTHDQEEAMSISDNILIMKQGCLQQKGRPQELYDNPANCFVADFLGTPPINKLQGVIHDGAVELTGGIPTGRQVSGPEQAEVYLSCRAESIRVDDQGEIPCTIHQVFRLGKEKILLADVGGQALRAYAAEEQELQAGQQACLHLKNKGVFVFDRQSGERLS